MTPLPATLAVLVAAVALAAWGAAHGSGDAARSPCADTDGFALSLASATGGEATPLAAARAFAAHNGGTLVALPLTGWRVVESTKGEASVAAERYIVHVVRGPDGTWQVDSGRRCRA